MLKIRCKILLALGLITLTLMGTLFVMTERITFDGIAQTEKNQVNSNFSRFTENLNIDFDNLNRIVHNWATRDDTYDFVKNQNNEYINLNLSNQTFTNLNLNAILFFDENHDFVYGKKANTPTLTSPSSIQEISDSTGVYDRLFCDNGTCKHSTTGLILIGDIPVMAAAHPILNSSDEDPSRGTMIIYRFFDEYEVEILSGAIGLPLSVKNLNQENLPADFQVAKNELSTENQVFIQPQNKISIAGYGLVEDIDGEPILIAKIEDYRPAYVQGLNSMFYTAISFLTIGSMVFLGMTLLIEKLVIHRLTVLDKTVTKIQKTNDYSNIINPKGNDELSSLTKNINNMLKVIENNTTNLENQVDERTKKLVENQEKLKSILNASPDAIMALDVEGNITECNDQLAKLFEGKRSDLIGQCALKFIDEDQSTQIYDKIVKAVKQNKTNIRYEGILHKKNNAEYIAEVSIGIMRDPQNNLIGFVAVVRDLTEKKRLEHKLMVNQRLAAIGELAGMVGHDLRNPLTAIKNAEYLIKKKCRECKKIKIRPLLQVMERSIEYADKIINDLAEYSKEIQINLEETSPKEIVNQTLTIIKIPNNIKVLNKTSKTTKLQVDITKTIRVMTNLIKNAIDAMPNGGTLKIESKKTNNNITITITDTGTGITKENIEKIFTPLYTTKAKGMGFGLPICKKIIEEHNGTIKVESQIDKGTKITITLPPKPNRAYLSD